MLAAITGAPSGRPRISPLRRAAQRLKPSSATSRRKGARLHPRPKGRGFRRENSDDYVVVDTAPGAWALGASIAVSNLVIVPCTPSELDLEATVGVLAIIDQVRTDRRGLPRVILVPNRVDARTLEGKQLVDELAGLREVVSPTIGCRSAFVRAFSTGRSIAEMANGQVGHREIQLLYDLVQQSLGTMHGSSQA